MEVVAAVKVAKYLWQSSNLVDRVNKTQEFFWAFDANHDYVLQPHELETMTRALNAQTYKNHPEVVNLRALVYAVYMGVHLIIDDHDHEIYMYVNACI
jgi:hypothetical protein